MHPCGLHIILAHHRYSWNAVMEPIVNKNQTGLIFEAFGIIKCGYLSTQMERYYNKKSKFYDGNESLKMIGDDCKKIVKIILKSLWMYFWLKRNVVTLKGNHAKHSWKSSTSCTIY